MAESVDRRCSPRWPVTLLANCLVGTHFLRNAVADLSSSGAFIRTTEIFPEGLPVRVAMALPTDEGPRLCTFVGTVARVAPDTEGDAMPGIGVAFSSETLAGSDGGVLRSYLEQLAPEVAEG